MHVPRPSASAGEHTEGTSEPTAAAAIAISEADAAAEAILLSQLSYSQTSDSAPPPAHGTVHHCPALSLPPGPPCDFAASALGGGGCI